MLIENAKGRKDGHSGYSRLLGNEELGCLISKLQSTVISNGTELEKMILDRSSLIDELDSFVFKAIEGAIPQGVYVCTKKVFKQSKVYYIDALKGIEPDLLVFVVEVNRVCKIIELKDGDAFDTNDLLLSEDKRAMCNIADFVEIKLEYQGTVRNLGIADYITLKILLVLFYRNLALAVLILKNPKENMNTYPHSLRYLEQEFHLSQNFTFVHLIKTIKK